MSQFTKALKLASEKHKDQRRKSDGSPYINHLIEVADHLYSLGGIQSDEILCAAILHDIVEDTPTTIKEISGNFGVSIANVVSELTKDNALSAIDNKNKMLETFRYKSQAAKTIKLADLLSNVANIPSAWDGDRVNKYLKWIEDMLIVLSDTNQSLEKTANETLKAVIVDRRIQDAT
jgi:(p)ppGpp synthase/HD superfamily hydrolase